MVEINNFHYYNCTMKKILLIIATTLLLVSCTDKQTKKEIETHASATSLNENYVKPLIKQNNDKIDSFISSLSLEQKISQLFIENLEGCTSFRSYETIGEVNGSDDDTPLIAGGYLFFGYNIADTKEDQIAFNNSIRDYSLKYNQIPPFLAVDQEGGWVSRLRKLSPALPSNEDVANKSTVSEAYDIYKEQAITMKDLGFHMNLAPVIEVVTEDNKDFLDGRGFGDATKVLNYGRACVNAYENNGIATVVKHFPGNTNTDPHVGLPIITLSKEKLEETLKPFIEVLDYNPEAVLMSHAITQAVDNGVPACLSHVWVTDILRNKIGYDGIIFSDDIFMGALALNGYGPEKAAVMAIEAGIDCIMISEKRFAKAAKILYKKALEDSVFMDRINESVKRIISYKVNNGIITL